MKVTITYQEKKISSRVYVLSLLNANKKHSFLQSEERNGLAFMFQVVGDRSTGLDINSTGLDVKKRAGERCC